MSSTKQETARPDTRVEFHRVKKEETPDESQTPANPVPTVDVDDLVADVRAHMDDRMNGIEAGLERLALLADALTRTQSPFGEASSPPPAPISKPAPSRTVVVEPTPEKNAPQTPGPRATVMPQTSVTENPRALVARVAQSPRVNAILLSWAETLVGDLGHDGVPEGLAHLEAIGWIGPDVRARLARIADGIDMPEPRASVSWRLSPAALRSSLEHIDRLRGTRGD